MSVQAQRRRAAKGKQAAPAKTPYLPGIDGMRALAVAAVVVYHADSSWLPGGYLGVEVFFVLSGYLITLLLIEEHASTGRIRLGRFWLRRARRLLPALFVMLAGLAVYMAVTGMPEQGRVRGDFVAGLGYVSNWHQLAVGQGYTAATAFAPLRHLWSLAVEEQFYLVWPLVMWAVLRLGRAALPRVGMWFAAISVGIALSMAFLFAPGDIDGVDNCLVSTHGYWPGGRALRQRQRRAVPLDREHPRRGPAARRAFATVWRPLALIRGPMRPPVAGRRPRRAHRPRRPRLADGEPLAGAPRHGLRRRVQPVGLPRRIPRRRRVPP